MNGASRTARGMLAKTARSRAALMVGAAALMLVVMAVSVALGSYRLTPAELLAVLAGDAASGEHAVIVWEIRMPRVCLAALCGMGLSLSGAVFQGVFRNPLVEPYILGVSSGAACGAALSIVLFGGAAAGSLLSSGGLAFVAAVAAMALAYSIATVGRETPLVNLILAGTIVSSVFTALLNLLKTAATDGALREITFWLMGGFYTADWDKVAGIAPGILLGGAVCIACGWKLNVLAMGENEARTLGISTGRLKLLLLAVATFLTAACVSQVGIISWVGLMIPHMARMMAGPDHRTLLPLSALCGGAFLVICDTLARTLTMGELPVSIITSILGAPYLIYLLRTNRQVYFE